MYTVYLSTVYVGCLSCTNTYIAWYEHVYCMVLEHFRARVRTYTCIRTVVVAVVVVVVVAVVAVVVVVVVAAVVLGRIVMMMTCLSRTSGILTRGGS